MFRPFLTLVVAFALVGALAGCTSAGLTNGANSGSTPGTIAVVASTNVWGSIAKELGGSRVSVTSLVDDPNKDPHEYSASARDQLELSKAQVVIENGGGYDDFMDTMLASANNPSAVTVNAVALTGHANDTDLNEHVWYDFVGVKKLAEKLARTFATIEPAHAPDFRLKLAAFERALDALIAREAALRGTFAGIGVAITEPVPSYLLDAIALVDKTPPAFSKAIEDGTDAAPAVLKATLNIFDTKSVKLLAYNEQTTGAETEAVLAAAQKNGIAVVAVRETVPAGTTYLAWMSDNVSAIEKALAR